MRFEWHDQKDKDNEKKHGIPFKEGLTAFNDSSALVMKTERHSEERFVLLGKNPIWGILLVVYCERENKIRIISVRKASKRERNIYEKRL